MLVGLNEKGKVFMHDIHISVRNLVEFIMRSGDITISSTGLRDADAMQEGTRIHKKLQRKMGAGYQAEVPLAMKIPVTFDDIDFTFTLDGRADGIFSDENGQVVDEIKGVYRDIRSMKEPVPVHRAQALCYAYIYASGEALPGMGIRMTYCHIPTERVRYFTEYLDFPDIEESFFAIVREYAKWIAWQIRWQENRNASIKAVEFPFPYREGQGKLVKGVYQSILRKKRLYIQAPTGVGKTISTVFPAVKSVGEGLTEKIFYLTAKTITRTVAEDTFGLLGKEGVRIKCVTITAKEKICILDKPACNPGACPRAKGHFDRVNEAVFDVLNSEDMITRDTVLLYAQKHEVCPFEMCLDISTWCDVIIGDYNYAFDPIASLKRFFSLDKENDFVFLIDEAHNLVDRAREMYSATVVKEDFLAMKRMLKSRNKKLAGAMESCNRALLELKRKCDDMAKYDLIEVEGFILRGMRLCTLTEQFLQEQEHGGSGEGEMISLFPEERERLLDFYFNLREFQNIYELADDYYTVYGDYSSGGDFRLHLQCMDPSANLNLYLKKGRCSVFFSATLLPIHYYREQLAGREEDYAVYAPSPFLPERRLLMIGRGVSTKYAMRSAAMYEKIASYIFSFVQGKVGNYLIFFPSYRLMEDVEPYLADLAEGMEMDVLLQENSMAEKEREEFLSHFQDSPERTTLGLCVMGGIFGEGIDLKRSRLIGVALVGTGLPMVCTENELFREYFDQRKGSGFSYAYQYPGMNKVLQAAGRVIRTTEDVGAILLLDDRFLQGDYQSLFPREWFPYDVVTLKTLPGRLREFWGRW